MLRIGKELIQNVRGFKRKSNAADLGSFLEDRKEKNSIPDNKKIREQIEKDHGWTGDGEPQKR